MQRGIRKLQHRSSSSYPCPFTADIVDQCHPFYAILWSLWKNCNLKPWQNATQTVTQLLDRAMRLIEDWTAANDAGPTWFSRNVGKQIGRERNVQQWCSRYESCEVAKTYRGKCKWNIDASFSIQLKVCVLETKAALCSC